MELCIEKAHCFSSRWMGHGRHPGGGKSPLAFLEQVKELILLHVADLRVSLQLVPSRSLHHKFVTEQITELIY